jgi:hypothetical protein
MLACALGLLPVLITRGEAAFLRFLPESPWVRVLGEIDPNFSFFDEITLAS